MNSAIDLICQLCKEHFYGSLTLKFESGKIVILKKEETIKPQPNNPNPNTGEMNAPGSIK